MRETSVYGNLVCINCTDMFQSFDDIMDGGYPERHGADHSISASILTSHETVVKPEPRPECLLLIMYNDDDELTLTFHRT
jgi:hypothetical protein